MKIVKILNNNFAIVKENDGIERIVTGRGLCYGKKIGSEIQTGEFDKVFCLENKTQLSKFEELIMELPIEQIELAERIITEARCRLGKKISDAVYISLADHISFSIKRFQHGLTIHNQLLWDIQRFYPEEYNLGLIALDFIEEQYAIRLPDDEAGFIALHIVNADQKDMDEDMYHITQIMKELTNIVKYTYQKEFDVTSMAYHRFITHLRFFVQRAFSDKKYNGEFMDNDLLNMVKSKYTLSYSCVTKIEEYLKNECNQTVTDEEKLYLSIHIERAMNSDK